MAYGSAVAGAGGATGAEGGFGSRTCSVISDSDSVSESESVSVSEWESVCASVPASGPSANSATGCWVSCACSCGGTAVAPGLSSAFPAGTVSEASAFSAAALSRIVRSAAAIIGSASA